MKYVDCSCKLRHIYNPEGPTGITYPDFFNPGTDAWHRLPIIRLNALLHLVNLVAGFSASLLWKRSQVSQRTAAKLHRFAIRHCHQPYKILYKYANHVFASAARNGRVGVSNSRLIAANRTVPPIAGANRRALGYDGQSLNHSCPPSMTGIGNHNRQHFKEIEHLAFAAAGND
jgi:hypothetical protein